MNKTIEPKQISIYEVSKIQKAKINQNAKDVSKKYEDKETFYILAHDVLNAIEKAGMIVGLDESLIDVKLFSEDAFF